MTKKSTFIALGIGATLILLVLGYMSRKMVISAYCIYEGEEYNYKAGFILKNQRVPVNERKKIYRKSCDYFLQAYRHYPKSFDFNRCEYAVDSCLWVEDFESVNRFRNLQQNFKDNGGYKEADSPIALW